MAELTGNNVKKVVNFDYHDLVKATENFSPSMLIGKGSHGGVYKGILEDNATVVAVKISSIPGVEVQNDNYKKLANEISVLSSLNQNVHIIDFLGSGGSGHDPIRDKNRVMVMEFMPNGSLHDWLHVSATPPPWHKRVEVALQVAKGIRFLHEGDLLPVIHRDIKPANILFDSNWNSKLADFGLSVFSGEDSGHAAGTVGYLDPVYTSPEKLSTTVDVFSYGVVLLEIISGRKAINMSNSPSSVVEWAIPLIEKQRIHEICDPKIAPLPTDMISAVRRLLSIAARCVSSNERIRPSIGEIVTEIESNSIERVRISVFSTVFQTVFRIKRRRRLATECRASFGTRKGSLHGDVTKRKMLLKELLADVAPN